MRRWTEVCRAVLTRTRADEKDVTTVAAKAPVEDSRAVQRRAAITVPSRTTSEMPALAGPRSRASMLATTSLILGLGSAFSVLSGVLAGVGVALGLLATFAAIGGIAATSRRHVSGKGDALLGMVLGLGAIVVGVLAMTGNLPWLNTGTDQVMRLHDWLDVRLPWLFPNS
jgi:hypothetical protein